MKKTMPPTVDSRALDAQWTAARIVWAELNMHEDDAGPERQAALDDLWTSDAAEDAERVLLLATALGEYAAFFAWAATEPDREKVAAELAALPVWSPDALPVWSLKPTLTE